MIIRRTPRALTRLFACSALVFSLTAAPSGYAQGRYIPNLEGRLKDLEQQMRQIERQGESNGNSSGSNAASLRIDIQELREELRHLQGMIEQNNYAIRQMRRSLKMIDEDTSFRLQQLERQGVGKTDAPGVLRMPSQQDMEGSGQKPEGDRAPEAATSDVTMPEESAPLTTMEEQRLAEPPKPEELQAFDPRMQVVNEGGEAEPSMKTDAKSESKTKADTEADKDAGTETKAAADATPTQTGQQLQFSSAREHYNYAIGRVRNEQYKPARQSLIRFIANYPDHRLLGNAYYWLGETYYAQNSYIQAADMFRQGFEESPEGIKAPDNLFKLAKSLIAMDKQEEACIVLAQIRQRYGSSHPEIAGMAFDTGRSEGCDFNQTGR